MTGLKNYTDCSGNILAGKVLTKERDIPQCGLLLSGIITDYDQYFKIDDIITSSGVTQTGIVFEGFVNDYDGKLKNDVKLFSRYYELVDVYPTGIYSGTIDVIVSGLVRDWTNNLDCDSNSLSTGLYGMTGYFAGRMKFGEIITNLGKNESKTWYINQNEKKLYLGNYAIDSEITFSGINDVYGIDRIQSRHKNKVDYHGGYTGGTGLMATTGDVADQNIYGVMAVKDDNPLMLRQDLLNSGAYNFLQRVMNLPLRYCIKDKQISLGMPQVGEKMTVDPDIPLLGFGGNLETGSYNINKNEYDIKTRVSDAFVADNIYFGEQERLEEVNAYRLEQVAGDIGIGGEGGGINLTTGAGAPSSTPDAIGDVYVDTTNLCVYMAAHINNAAGWGYLGKAQASVFTKDSVASLVGWFDADSAYITKDGGDNVTVWTDRSDAGNHLTETSAATKPVWYDNIINGHPAVHGNGSAYIYKSSITTMGSTCTVFIVYKPTGLGGYYCVVNLTPSDEYFQCLDLTGFMYAVNSVYLKGTATVINTAAIWSLVFNGATSSVRKNNDSPTTGNAGSGYAGVRIVLFGSGTYQTKGYIAEVLIYSDPLSAANIEIVKDYLNNKYGIW